MQQICTVSYPITISHRLLLQLVVLVICVIQYAVSFSFSYNSLDAAIFELLLSEKHYLPDIGNLTYEELFLVWPCHYFTGDSFDVLAIRGFDY